jgi:predicted nucleotidyltransferase
MQSLLENKRSELATICKALSIKKMVVFGSAVSNKFTDQSDIDFLISFNDGISIEEYTENYFKLHYRLRELFNRDIDIITERTLSNPYFIDSINKTKKVIYEA